MKRLQSSKNNSDALCKEMLEYVLELLNPRTKDTYRVRLHNPFSILLELHIYINKWIKGELKRFEDVEFIISELKEIFEIKNFENLNFAVNSWQEKIVGKHQKMLYIFNSKHQDSKLKDNPLNQKIAIGIILDILNQVRENSSLKKERMKKELYFLQVYILECVKQEDKDIACLRKLTGFYITQLLQMGYSKHFLSKYLERGLSFINNTNDLFEYLIKLGNSSNNKELTLTFEVKIKAYSGYPIDDYQKIWSRLVYFLGSSEKINENDTWIIDFEEKNTDTGHIKVEFNGNHFDNFFDYNDYGQKYKRHFLKTLDILILGFPFLKLNIERIRFGNKLEVFNTPFEGNIKSSEKYHKEIHENLQNIKNNSTSSQVNERILRAVRFYRLGMESTEKYQQLLNYWIGLEQLFSSGNESSSFSQIKEYYIYSELPRYMEDLLINLNEDIKRMLSNELYNKITNGKKNYPIVWDKNSDEKIILNRLNTIISEIKGDDYPLLNYRINSFIAIFNNEKNRKDFYSRHKQNVEWQLARIYRLRNEIVHEAATLHNMELIVENLRHYLDFMIKSVISYFSKSPQNLNDDDKIDMEDFFISRKLTYLNFEKNDYQWEYRLIDKK